MCCTIATLFECLRQQHQSNRKRSYQPKTRDSRTRLFPTNPRTRIYNTLDLFSRQLSTFTRQQLFISLLRLTSIPNSIFIFPSFHTNLTHQDVGSTTRTGQPSQARRRRNQRSRPGLQLRLQ
ncbi:hypothetical protein AWENTII_001725 [Aspergillus wentii]